MQARTASSSTILRERASVITTAPMAAISPHSGSEFRAKNVCEWPACDSSDGAPAPAQAPPAIIQNAGSRRHRGTKTASSPMQPTALGLIRDTKSLARNARSPSRPT